MRDDRLTFELVSPGNLEEVLGELHGVERASSSLTFALESETRMIGNLALKDSNYIDGAMVRIVHEVPAWGYRRELATMFPSGYAPAISQGVSTGTLDLASPLAALRDDRWPWDFGIPAGRQARAVLEYVLQRAQIAYRFDPGCPAYAYGETNVYAIGDSVLETASEVAAHMGCELCPDGHGTVVVRPALAKGRSAPEHEVSGDDAMGAVEASDGTYSTPNRVVVRNKTAGGVEVAAYADAPVTAPSSLPRLGRRITEVIDMPDLSPATGEAARMEAQRVIDAYASAKRRHTLKCSYRPLREGDAVRLRAGGVDAACQVLTVELSLAPGLPMTLTLEEV